MDTLISLFAFADRILFISFAVCVFYLLFYAVASRFYRPRNHPETQQLNRFAVLFPAYKADNVIIASVYSFIQQQYPADLYDVIVIADQMKETTCDELRQLGAHVLTATYSDSSKAKALKLAMEMIASNKQQAANNEQPIRDESKVNHYDMVVIMDADNTTTPYFLHEINKARAAGLQVIQAHRTAKNLNTEIALLDAASEEINNGIFRSGHVAVGLSCALIGSGMAIDACWFAEHVAQLQTAGEDKELEALLQRQRIYVGYLSQLPVYDEKTQQQSIIKQQRKRWIATQWGSLRTALPDLPHALWSGNLSYADKILQWMLPPRLIQIAGIFGFATVTTLTTLLEPDILPGIALKWWILAAAQTFALLLPLPASLANKQLLKALCHMPRLALTMAENLFHLKGANKKFIHTKHS